VAKVADEKDAQTTWLPVIGKALAYLCLQEVQRKEPERVDSVLKRVKFLQGLGLSRNDAANAAGSSAASVQVLRSLAKGKKVKNDSAKKKTSRR
jgi:hypothetical protein